MRSPFLALLLIVNLLACPVRCLSCEAKGTVGEECAQTCVCCSHDQEASPSEVPEPCGGDCDCQGCICEGAVVETCVELPDRAVETVDWLEPSKSEQQVLGNRIAIFLRRLSFPLGKFLGGREVRVAHQSWLI
ncbi:hypothetical protein FF011L_39690 [Roseimaritima multifibrata]|uniref:Uncharacterized protein n=1 Tax=Roseimaritima multifibrata TaxID=1930274 RepID=A0A517MJY4_9BACT|nr:hypothetical protein [Roseimaritima multifibrata]QDS95178.1 hypothetical protein FF011L_39690 [Roseimaritima multifibrata]